MVNPLLTAVVVIPVELGLNYPIVENMGGSLTGKAVRVGLLNILDFQV